MNEVNLRKNLDNAYQITISFFKICFETIADAFSDSPRAWEADNRNNKYLLRKKKLEKLFSFLFLLANNLYCVGHQLLHNYFALQITNYSIYQLLC